MKEMSEYASAKKTMESFMIETERLYIQCSSRDQMEEFIESQTDDDLKAAYTEMLNGCLEAPDQWEWHALWMIGLKDGAHIGELCFKGLDPDGRAEIGYGIAERYRGQGYASEAVRAAAEWAFGHPEVFVLEAETAPDNAASKRVLEKCGFAPSGTIGEEGPRYVLKHRQQSARKMLTGSGGNIRGEHMHKKYL